MIRSIKTTKDELKLELFVCTLMCGIAHVQLFAHQHRTIFLIFGLASLTMWQRKQRRKRHAHSDWRWLAMMVLVVRNQIHFAISHIWQFTENNISRFEKWWFVADHSPAAHIVRKLFLLYLCLAFQHLPLRLKRLHSAECLFIVYLWLLWPSTILLNCYSFGCALSSTEAFECWPLILTTFTGVSLSHRPFAFHSDACYFQNRTGNATQYAHDVF